jgi:hypothetical protein
MVGIHIRGRARWTGGFIAVVCFPLVAGVSGCHSLNAAALSQSAAPSRESYTTNIFAERGVPARFITASKMRTKIDLVTGLKLDVGMPPERRDEYLAKVRQRFDSGAARYQLGWNSYQISWAIRREVDGVIAEIPNADVRMKRLLYAAGVSNWVVNNTGYEGFKFGESIWPGFRGAGRLTLAQVVDRACKTVPLSARAGGPDYLRGVCIELSVLGTVLARKVGSNVGLTAEVIGGKGPGFPVWHQWTRFEIDRGTYVPADLSGFRYAGPGAPNRRLAEHLILPLSALSWEKWLAERYGEPRSDRYAFEFGQIKGPFRDPNWFTGHKPGQGPNVGHGIGFKEWEKKDRSHLASLP